MVTECVVGLSNQCSSDVQLLCGGFDFARSALKGAGGPQSGMDPWPGVSLLPVSWKGLRGHPQAIISRS